MDADDTVDFDAIEVKEDCYGNQYESIRWFASWSSSDTEVATVDSSGTATALNGGETEITAAWTGRYYYTQPCYYYAALASSDVEPDLPACGGCSWYSVSQRPSSKLRVRPKITSLTPSRAMIGSTTNVSIQGRGFGSNPTVVIGGTGVTYSGSSGSTTQLSGSFNIAVNGTQGNHTVQVSNKGQTSNSVNFFVQIPSKIVPLDAPVAPNGIGPLMTPVNEPRRRLDGTPINPANYCGVYRNYLFFLGDQDNPSQETTFRPFTLDEVFSNYSSPNNLDPPANLSGIIGPGVEIADMQSVGFIYPQCLQPGDNQTFTQKFLVTINGVQYSPSTTIVISRGNFGGTLKVDRVITTP